MCTDASMRHAQPRIIQLVCKAPHMRHAMCAKSCIIHAVFSVAQMRDVVCADTRMRHLVHTDAHITPAVCTYACIDMQCAQKHV